MARVKTGVFLILWISMMVTGVFLGRWQLDRLAWKTVWLDRIDHAYSQPIDLNKFKNLSLPCTSVDRTFFIRTSGVVTYSQDMDHTVIVKPRVVDGMFGRYVLTRATLPNGAKIWVNRGFVPDDVKIPPPPKTVQATIQIRGTDMPLPPILSDNPGVILDNLRSYPTCDPLAVIGVVEPSEGRAPWPQPVGVRPNPPNDHLYYAIFWFTMSAIALIMGGVGFYKRRGGFRPI